MGEYTNGLGYNLIAGTTAIVVSVLSLAYLTNTLLSLFGHGYRLARKEGAGHGLFSYV